jgi:transcriptional regulator EpsA
MPFFNSLSPPELTSFLRVVQDSLTVRRHIDLFHWLHGDLQKFLPHDILIAAWGDFYLGLVHLDVLSFLPGMRTTEVDREDILPFILGMFARWMDSERAPFTMQINTETFQFKTGQPETDLEKGIMHMRSCLVQGIKDERGRHDCLYVALSSGRTIDPIASRSMELLLPYIDSALRQVAHLPVQYPDLPELKSDVDADEDFLESPSMQERGETGLSLREQEIMHWVCMGKTNPEIGQILDISYFTVKNHLQRMFRKLDVMNRAQAVAKFERMTRPV